MTQANRKFSYDDPLPTEEFIRLANQEVSPEALAEMSELFRWFKRRYPTVKERFAYATRKTKALRRMQTSKGKV